MKNNKLITIGVLGATAVFLGALGAHFLKNKLATGLITIEQLNGFDTAVKYQMYHVLAMLCLVFLSKQNSCKYIIWSYNCFFIGIILFSGSLYFLCTRNLLQANWLTLLGPVTPIGGLFFVMGWLLLAYTGLKNETEK